MKHDVMCKSRDGVCGLGAYLASWLCMCSMSIEAKGVSISAVEQSLIETSFSVNLTGESSFYIVGLFFRISKIRPGYCSCGSHRLS